MEEEQLRSRLKAFSEKAKEIAEEEEAPMRSIVSGLIGPAMRLILDTMFGVTDSESSNAQEETPTPDNEKEKCKVSPEEGQRILCIVATAMKRDKDYAELWRNTISKCAQEELIDYPMSHFGSKREICESLGDRIGERFLNKTIPHSQQQITD